MNCWRSISVMALVGVLLSGCGTSATETADASGAPAALAGGTANGVEKMRLAVQYEFQPFDSPGQMKKSVDVALAGKVSTIQNALAADELDGRGLVIVGLDVTRPWKTTSKVGDRIYFQFPRAKNIDASSYYREVLPTGTEIALFGFDESFKFTFLEGDPGAPVLSPVPQGVFIPVPRDGLVNVWGSDLPQDQKWRKYATLDALEGSL